MSLKASFAVAFSLHLTLLLSGCSGCHPEKDTPYYDFVAEFQRADTKTETRSVVFGTPEARSHLVSGWSGDALDQKRNLPFVWSHEIRSQLRFDLLGPRELEAVILCRLRRAPRGVQRDFTVTVNGRRIQTVSVERKLREYRISIPAEATRAGENLLAFDFDPPPTQPEQKKTAQILWYRLDLGGDSDPVETPVADLPRQLLFLPAGSQLAYPLYINPRSSWQAERIAPRGKESRLEITLETDLDGKRIVAVFNRAERKVSVPLELEGRTPALLTLTVTAEGIDPSGGMLIQAPALWAPAPVLDVPQVAAVESRPSRPNVFLYLVDTLRQDRLGCYGYTKPVSPAIDAFAAESTLFVNAIGQSSWTKPTVASIFSGMWPLAHGAISWKQKLPAEAETLAEILRGAGYQTGAFVTNPNVVKAYGFDQGFEDFTRKLKKPSDAVNEMVLDWLDNRDRHRPFFLYVHTMDPHAPYSPPEPFRQQFAPQADAMPTWTPRWKWPLEALPFFQNLYDGEVAFNDHSFGKLMENLEEQGLYDDSLIVFVSDHGEEFKEHQRWRHGANLHAETLNVPLIIKFPQQQDGLRIEELAQHIDLMPTILDYLRLPVPDAVEGRSFAGLAPAHSTPHASRPQRVYSHLRLGRAPQRLSLVDGAWKLIKTERPDQVTTQLYNREADPGEKRNLANELPVRTAVLASLLDRKASAFQPLAATKDAAPDEETLEALRALGYLQ